MKFIRWVLCWACYWLGDLCSRMDYFDRMYGLGFFQAYQKFMQWSIWFQGLEGFRKWPWGEDELWEPDNDYPKSSSEVELERLMNGFNSN